MTTVLVWFLIVSVYGDNTVIYSPPVATVADCQRMQQALDKAVRYYSQCVQVNLIVQK